jgi:hypothetical protein
MQTLEEFLESNDVAMRCREVAIDGDRTSLIPEPWAPHRYSCELHRSSGVRPVTATIGSDNGAPEMREVLDTVAAEAAVVDEAQSYEQWSVQMGFDPDSRRGELIYRTARRQARHLRQLLGEEQYARLLWQTERL